MRLGDVFPSEYLKSGDLGGAAAGKRFRVVISDVKAWEDAKGNRKLSIGFVGSKKRLLANVTNSRSIAKVFGEETDAWVSRTIILFVTMVDYMGDQVEAIRVIADPAPPQAGFVQPAPPAAQPVNVVPAPTQNRPPATFAGTPPETDIPPVSTHDAFGIPNDPNDDIPF
jgi:hypothetical protein